jgi:fermentation-respiration switch protein FrsA (DUF1100 family)
MAVLIWFLIAAAFGYAGVLVLMYVFQRSLTYFPDRKRTAPAQAVLPQAQEITFASTDGERLIAWAVAPREGKPVVLYFHGNGGALKLRVARFRKLIADGNGLLALSYRGYGGSTGVPSEAGLIRDAHAAYEEASARWPARKLVLWGESLGTAVAVALAAERHVDGVILDAPFTSAADVGAAAYPFAPVRWLMRDQFHSDRRIARVRAPMLVLHGECDRIVPIAYGERLFALAHEPKRFARFASAGHIDLDDYGAIDVAKAFLAGVKS